MPISDELEALRRGSLVKANSTYFSKQVSEKGRISMDPETHAARQKEKLRRDRKSQRDAQEALRKGASRGEAMNDLYRRLLAEQRDRRQDRKEPRPTHPGEEGGATAKDGEGPAVEAGAAATEEEGAARREALAVLPEHVVEALQAKYDTEDAAVALDRALREEGGTGDGGGGALAALMELSPAEDAAEEEEKDEGKGAATEETNAMASVTEDAPEDPPAPAIAPEEESGEVAKESEDGPAETKEPTSETREVPTAEKTAQDNGAEIKGEEPQDATTPDTGEGDEKEEDETNTKEKNKEVDEKEEEEKNTKEKNKPESGTENALKDSPTSAVASEEESGEFAADIKGEPAEEEELKAQTREIPTAKGPGQDNAAEVKGEENQEATRPKAGEVNKREEEETATKEQNKTESGTENVPEDPPTPAIASEEESGEMTAETEEEPAETEAPKAQTEEVPTAEEPARNNVVEGEGGEDQEATAPEADKDHRKEGAAARAPAAFAPPLPPPRSARPPQLRSARPPTRARTSFCCWFPPRGVVPEDEGEWIDYGGRTRTKQRSGCQRKG